MAETVLSMARSTLRGAVEMTASAAAAEMSLLMGVRKDIWFIKDELETMQAFLEVAEAKKNNNILLKVWAKQVRNMSYNIEDCLSEFMVHVESQSLLQRLMKLKDRHRIAMQIRDLKSRVEEVSVRNTRYSLITTEASCTIGEVESYVEDVRSHSASNIDETELLGFSKPKEELIELMDVNSKLGIAKIICVVGMGGLGKTTLARKAYEDTVKNFSCCAWIIVSQAFSKVEMLKDMIMQLLGDQALKQRLRELEGKMVQVDDLAIYLTGKLEDKRYLIVLDDLWTIESWKWINHIAFPNSNNKGSKIIVTTRDVGLARQFTLESLIYHLKPLEPVDATNLLLRKTRKTQEDIKNDKFKELVEQLVKKCGNLPLAILTIGGILADKKIAEWEDIYKQLPSELESNPSLEAIRSMVILSYNHLPSHLKSCFLYLSIFPEDFEIQRRRLVDRWIIEGFVRARGGVNIEDVGKSYFNELINRSMIMPSRVNIEGSVKSCRVHDIIHDVIVSISRDANFVYLVGDNIARVTNENFCHVAYHDGKCQNIGIDWSHVRSLTLFGVIPEELSRSIFSLDLRMLRVLDLADAKYSLTQKDINNLKLLRHLKYVNIDYFDLEISICKLKGVQTFRTKLPTKIGNFQKLYRLYCTYPIVVKIPWAPRGTRNLALHFPDIRQISSRVIEELGKLTRLRKLTVSTIDTTEQKCKVLCAAVEKLSSLCSLKIDSYYNCSTLEWVHCISSPPPLLRTLKLGGHLGVKEIPNWVRSLMHLVKIYLTASHLKESRSMEILEALPNLMFLCLQHESYIGEKLVFRAGALPNLRKLEIIDLARLREVRFEKDALPQIERIGIRECRLESGIVGIKHLPRLKEISLGRHGRVAKLDVLAGEVDAHPKHPILRLSEDRSEHDLGGVIQGSNAVRVEATEELLFADAAAGERLQAVISTTNVRNLDFLNLGQAGAWHDQLMMQLDLWRIASHFC